MYIDKKAEFEGLCNEVIKRQGIGDVLKWLESTDFFDAPASTKYHSSHKGGLVEHSLYVYYQLKNLLKAYPEVECSDETAAIVALLHDVCKANFYTVSQRNQKNERTGAWEKVDYYAVDEDFCFGGHGSKSVYLIMRYMDLTHEEAAAINSHMGAFNDAHVGKVFDQFPLAFLLHMADTAATIFNEED